jgi:hypothetical protein
MSDKSWKDYYSDTVEYVKNHPQIEIKPKSIVMIGDDRVGFYELFNKTRNSFIEEKFAKELKDAKEISGYWNEIADELTASLNLEEIIIDRILKWYLTDPLDCFARDTFDPLFHVFDGTSTIDDFEKDVTEKIAAKADKLYKDAYKNWASLQIIKILDADEVYEVHNFSYRDEATSIENSSATDRVEPVPEPGIVKKLDFDFANDCSHLTPRLIFHSKRYDRMVALRDFYNPRWRANRYSKNQEWINRRYEIKEKFGVKDLYPGMMIYVADDCRDLRLIADTQFICRPHINVEFEEKPNWFAEKGISSIKRHARVTIPKCGTIILSKYPFDAEKMSEAILPHEIDPSTMIRQYEVKKISYREEPEVIEEPVEEEHPNISVEDNDNSVVFFNEPEEEPVEEVEKAVEEVVEEPQEEAVEEEPEEEENPWGLEPEMVIKPIELGWEPEKMIQALDDLIRPIPPYPPSD